MNKEFIEFQKEFKKWQQKFGLTGYFVYFKYEELDDNYAEISMNHIRMVATVTLNSKLKDAEIADKNVARDAKHEALHLLIGKLTFIAGCRFTQPEEIDQADEELVNKLENLIDG